MRLPCSCCPGVPPLQDSSKVEAALLWMDEAPLQGSICFVLGYTVAVVLLFPGSILALAAGAVFGVVLGSVVVWLGTLLGQTLSFIVGRYLLRHLVVEYTAKQYPKWAAIDTAGERLQQMLRFIAVHALPINIPSGLPSIQQVRTLALAHS